MKMYEKSMNMTWGDIFLSNTILSLKYSHENFHPSAIDLTKYSVQ